MELGFISSVESIQILGLFNLYVLQEKKEYKAVSLVIKMPPNIGSDGFRTTERPFRRRGRTPFALAKPFASNKPEMSTQ